MLTYCPQGWAIINISISNVKCCAEHEYHNLKNIQNGLGGSRAPQSFLKIVTLGLFRFFSMLLVILKIKI